MISAIRQWWTGLSQRERVLVGVAGGLTAAVLLWLAARALLAGLESGAEAHREAIARAARVEAKAALLAAAPQTPPASQSGALDLWLGQSATDMGLTLDRNDARGERLASIAIASARAPAVVGWLAGLEAQGLVIERLSLTPGTDGTVAMTAEVRRP